MNYSKQAQHLPKYKCAKCDWIGRDYVEIPTIPKKVDNTGSCDIDITYCYFIKCPICNSELYEL